jgi:hypothetical protein
MRLLDTYALYCGAKIDKPFIYESYFPLPFTKYVTFQAETPYDSRNYAYWQDVLDMVIPILSKMGIMVIQLGLQKEMGYQRMIDLRGQTNMHQLAYIMRRSQLHFGPDSFGVHLASHFDIPIVSMYSISMPEVAGPHFGSKDKHVLFKAYERVGNKKPSYSPKESPKSINTIKPEEVANAIFKLLSIDYIVPFETIQSGERYSNQIIRELVPDSQHVMPQPEQPIEIRTDIFFDEKLLAHHLNYWQKAVVVTDKPLPIQLLKAFKPHIAMLSYVVTENDEPKFAQDVVQAGLPLLLMSRLTPEQIQAKKISYYEFGMINRFPEPKTENIAELQKGLSNLYYRSCKLIASQGKIFGSHADREANLPLLNDFEYHKAIDSPNFWQDADFYTFVKKL